MARSTVTQAWSITAPAKLALVPPGSAKPAFAEPVASSSPTAGKTGIASPSARFVYASRTSGSSTPGASGTLGDVPDIEPSTRYASPA
ncbi:MAG: hypothetical protein R3F34_17890 [Planctomycetota bacterium]